jgi:hypothetical protein
MIGLFECSWGDQSVGLPVRIARFSGDKSVTAVVFLFSYVQYVYIANSYQLKSEFRDSFGLPTVGASKSKVQAWAFLLNSCSLVYAIRGHA